MVAEQVQYIDREDGAVKTSLSSNLFGPQESGLFKPSPCLGLFKSLYILGVYSEGILFPYCRK